ncbi:hypothetical protein ABC766_27110 [Methylobacterium fujisawaense]|uniref:hypothetical protein n=1 Tax=Methylobacterium fujisawaense TaxID=107400 RepID=UPI0031F5AFE1
MSMPSPPKPSDIEVQIAALRAVVHALMGERITSRDREHIQQAAQAEVAALTHSDEFKARAVAAVDEIIAGEKSRS